VNLHGRRVLVTGASRGIGASLVRASATAGAQVALVARDADAIGKLAADVGGVAYPTDLTERASVAGLVERVERDGDIDVLVNNAGVDDPLLAHAPWHITDLLLVGVDRHTNEQGTAS
jgi:NAD(P)-dependent dehydrogenase (short-subunit alcohol dehydrogenase family)